MIKLPDIDCEQVADEIGNFIIEQCSHHTGAVIGLSGGVDSSLVAFLAKRAFDKHNWQGKDKKHLIGYSISTNETSPDSICYANEVAYILGIVKKDINIENSITTLQNDLKCSLGKFVRGNMISRHRANVLWTIAAIEKKIVLGTGNADEDFGVGYYTLGGDGLVSCSPIGMLSKRLVRKLAEWIGVPEKIVKRTPTAELEQGQTDESDLGYTYALVEFVMEAIKNPISDRDPIDVIYTDYQDEVIKNLRAFKWNKNPFDALRDILYRHQGALYKQGIVNPPIAKVTLKYGE